MKSNMLWDWMNERHAVYLRRQQGLPREQWTADPIFKEYAFCNVFRELDRVTIWTREHIRERYADHPNLWFMLAIARTINWPPTLQWMMEAGVWPTGDEWRAFQAAALFQHIADHGGKVYTGAYMIRAESDPNNIWYNRTKHEYICHCVLGSLWRRREDWTVDEGLPTRPGCDTLQHAHSWFLPFHGWGPFMAYEVVTDLRHTRYLRNAPDIMSWANAGPGALRGLNRILNRPLNTHISPAAANVLMRELLEIANSGYNLSLGSHVPRPLEMRDIEHSLCEMDKYQRVLLGQGRPRAKFRPTSAQ